MGFFEILVIAVVALFVVGPERMPEAVRSVVLFIGRIKRSFNSARVELEKQIGADDIRRQLHNESVMESLGQLKTDLADIDPSVNSKSTTNKPTASNSKTPPQQSAKASKQASAEQKRSSASAEHKETARHEGDHASNSASASTTMANAKISIDSDGTQATVKSKP